MFWKRENVIIELLKIRPEFVGNEIRRRLIATRRGDDDDRLLKRNNENLRTYRYDALCTHYYG